MLKRALSAGLSGILIATIAVSAAPASGAVTTAAANCTLGGNGRPDWATCHNVVGTDVYGGRGPGPETDGVVYPDQVVGHLYSNPSWFQCRIDNGPWNGGGPHPHRWLYTESDDGGWGYVPDTAIYDETNPVLGCGEFA